ncbi:MAG: aminomethyl-transferring glycine dehydrogenase, partial [Clostridia bacterium]
MPGSQTYCYGTNHELRIVPVKDGVTDADALGALLNEDVAGLYLQQPNFFGQLEDVAALFALAKAQKVKCILGANPM